MSRTKQVVAVIVLWLLSLALAQNNEYTTSIVSNGEYLWQSTSDFIPSEPGQAYGTIPVGDEMTMEFDWTWHGRARAGTGDWELFFRVGFDSSISNRCDGGGSRYPSFWLPGTTDEMHVSVSSGVLCQKVQRFDNFGTISAGPEYHVHIHFDPTTVTLRASQTSDWPDNNVITQTYPRDPTPESVGQNASVWWISPGWTTIVNYAGDATFRNVVLTSVIYPTTTTTSPPTPLPTTTSPTTLTPTTAAPTTSVPTTASDTTTTGTQLTVFTAKPSAPPSPTEAEGQVSDETTSTPRSTLDDENIGDDGDNDAQAPSTTALSWEIPVAVSLGVCVCVCCVAALRGIYVRRQRSKQTAVPPLSPPPPRVVLAAGLAMASALSHSSSSQLVELQLADAVVVHGVPKNVDGDEKKHDANMMHVEQPGHRFSVQSISNMSAASSVQIEGKEKRNEQRLIDEEDEEEEEEMMYDDNLKIEAEAEATTTPGPATGSTVGQLQHENVEHIANWLEHTVNIPSECVSKYAECFVWNGYETLDKIQDIDSKLMQLQLDEIGIDSVPHQIMLMGQIWLLKQLAPVHNERQSHAEDGNAPMPDNDVEYGNILEASPQSPK